MDVFEIAGWKTGVSKSGVNFLEPKDSFQEVKNGFIYRQVLQSRQGFSKFAPRLFNNTRVLGIFEHTLVDGTKQCLAFDTDNAYLYNVATGVFDLIIFGGSLAGYAGFGITEPEGYIHGTSYPNKNNNDRFVFSGKYIDSSGGSAVFFYDNASNTVKNYTSIVDNPDYLAPSVGALERANYIYWFGARLNFGRPRAGGNEYAQGILYSGIRNASGAGDQYNIAGSGLVNLDTYEYMTGLSILGNVLAVNMDRSNWIVEKTTDVFNPYFTRKIPSVIGTDAPYSFVSWFDTVKSLGKTGLISQDARQSLRFDTKIPYFTADEILQTKFIYTYGGFDRLNAQFMWSYIDVSAEEDTQNKVLVYNYEEGTWSINDQRFTVFGQCDVGLNLVWNQIDETFEQSWLRWDTTENIWNKIGLSSSTQKTLAGDDMGFIYELSQDGDDYYVAISNVTQASQAVLTVEESAFKAGDLVVVQSVEGMLDEEGDSGINNYDPEEVNLNFTAYTVVSATDTSVTINLDSTNFTAATINTGSLSKVISFSAETIPLNPYREQGFMCYLSHIEFLLDTNAGFIKVDLYEDEDKSPYKTDVIVYPENTDKQRGWVTVIADQEANFHTIVMKQMSPSVIVKINSIRLHMQRGGMTSG